MGDDQTAQPGHAQAMPVPNPTCVLGDPADLPGELLLDRRVRPLVIGQVGVVDAVRGIRPEAAGLELPDFSPALGGDAGSLMDGFGSDFGFDSTDDLLTMGDDGGFNRRLKEGPERRLARMVEMSEERAAKILRKWAVDKAA